MERIAHVEFRVWYSPKEGRWVALACEAGVPWQRPSRGETPITALMAEEVKARKRARR